MTSEVIEVVVESIVNKVLESTESIVKHNSVVKSIKVEKSRFHSSQEAMRRWLCLTHILNLVKYFCLAESDENFPDEREGITIIDY